MDQAKSEFPWVLFTAAGNKYALSCRHVISLQQLNKVTPVPGASPEFRGVVGFRGGSLPLLSLRAVFGARSREDDISEFEKLMDARRQDHINWIAALEKSVGESTEFTLTTDPHKCAFGKWYDTYSTEKAGIMFRGAFARFDAPHKKIHALGVRAKELIAAGERAEAAALVASARGTTLREMMGVFDMAKAAFRENLREIVVTLGEGTGRLALAVDEIVSTERLTDFDETTIKDSFQGTGFLLGTGKRKDGEAVLLIDDAFLLNTLARRP